MKVQKWLITVGVLAVVLAIAGCASTDSTSNNDNGGSSGSKSSKATKNSCGYKATDGCTPHVGPNGKVRVDALIWHLVSARTAKSIGDQQYGLGKKANGKFVILKLKVHSDKNESATLSDDVVKLDIGGNTYDADNDGTVAAMGAGEQPFFLDTIGPDSNRTGIVVFDVPTKKLKKKIEARFNELGLGSTHGYIALPPLN